LLGLPTKPHKIKLTSVIKITALGQFPWQPDKAAILSKAKELNAILDVTQVEVLKFEEKQVTISAKADSVYEGSILLTYLVDQRAMLDQVITITDLGLFLSEPTNADILGRAKEKNPALVINELEVALLLPNQVVIRVKDNSTVYQVGSITLRYRLDNRIDLIDVIQETNLGWFDNDIPNETQILGRLRVLNKKMTTVKDLIVKNISANQAIIEVVNLESLFYNPGIITLHFQIRKLIDFRDSVSATDLGIFETLPTNDLILTRLHDLNPLLMISEIVITLVHDNKVVISTKRDSNIYSFHNLLLTFKVELKLIDLDIVIKDTDLGQFMNQPTNQEILAKLHDLNPTLDINQVWISYSNGSSLAVVSVIANSGIYRQGVVLLTYQVKN